MKSWQKVKKSENDLAFLIDGEGASVPYSGVEKEMIGSLAELWDNWERFLLLSIFVRTIAEAWQASTEFLVKQPDWQLNGSRIMGRFNRDQK